MKRKILISVAIILTAALLVTVLVACNKSYKQDALPDSPGAEAAVTSNGGMAVKVGNYLYFINGYAGQDGDNEFKNVVKGAIMRAPIENGVPNRDKVQTVVPKNVYNSEESSSLVIKNGYIYFTTPNDENNSNGDPKTSEMILMRSTLDGSKIETIAKFDDYTVTYRVSANYIVYKKGTELRLIDLNDKFEDSLVASEVGTVVFPDYADNSNALDDVVFVPRAGLYGEVTLYYYAYDASGNNEYKGTIVLNVKEKTASSEFKDVTSSSHSWAADSVDFLSYEGIAEGSNGKYRPSANITRGDFMLMLYRAFLEDEHKNDSITSNFSDVTKGSDTYSKETYQAVGVAKKLGIAQGTNGKFNPKSYITRQEAMTLIYRTLDVDNYDLSYTVSTTTSSFKDYSSVASYAKTAISDLIGHGIVIGNNSKINPTSNITRAEMAVILHRVLTY